MILQDDPERLVDCLVDRYDSMTVAKGNKQNVFLSSRVDSWQLATVFSKHMRDNDMHIQHNADELCWNSRTVSVQAYRYGKGRQTATLDMHCQLTKELQLFRSV